MTKEYFRHGMYAVNDVSVRAWNKSIQIDTIEGVGISRSLFFMALGATGGLLGLGVLFGDLLYWHETLLFMLFALGILKASWSVGILRVYSKLTGEKGWSVIGPFRTLQKMRSAIEVAISEQNRGLGRMNALYSAMGDA